MTVNKITMTHLFASQHYWVDKSGDIHNQASNYFTHVRKPSILIDNNTDDLYLHTKNR